MAKFREEIVFAALLADRQMAEATVHQDRIVHILEAVAPLLTAPLEAQVKALEAALEWYGEKAKAIYRHAAAREYEPLEAIYVELSLDGGNRAKSAALTEPKP